MVARFAVRLRCSRANSSRKGFRSRAVGEAGSHANQVLRQALTVVGQFEVLRTM